MPLREIAQLVRFFTPFPHQNQELMRAIWSGAIGFGLVNIPIKMYSATSEAKIELDMLDKHDLANIRFARINVDTGEEVAWGDIVKGYKMDDEYVVLDDEDFEAASPKKSQVIAIEEFIEEDQVDNTLYEAPYFIAPDKGGDRVYALFREALEKAGKVALGTYVMRGREHLCMLKANGNRIDLLRLRFADEVRDPTDLEFPSGTGIKPAELKMALALIAQLSSKTFDAEKYKNTYHDELMKRIHEKAKGKTPSKPKFKVVKSNAADLMEQLKASLETTSKPKKKAS
jgi:DNA end-binding protein Ku